MGTHSPSHAHSLSAPRRFTCLAAQMQGISAVDSGRAAGWRGEVAAPWGVHLLPQRAWQADRRGQEGLSTRGKGLMVTSRLIKAGQSTRRAGCGRVQLLGVRRGAEPGLEQLGGVATTAMSLGPSSPKAKCGHSPALLPAVSPAVGPSGAGPSGPACASPARPSEPSPNF